MNVLAKRIGKSWIVRWLFLKVYSRWLDGGDRVAIVTGWRSAHIDRGGGRPHSTILFWWFK